MSGLAAEYERRYPGAVADENQRQERMERAAFKNESRPLRRTTRKRGIVVPALPLDVNGRLRP